MDVLLYCLEMDEMLDYETLKSNMKRKKSQVERSYSQNASADHPGNKSPEESQKQRKPLARSSTVEGVPKTSGSKPVRDVLSNVPVIPQPRYHPYEEVYIPPKTNPKPQIKPPVARKPHSDSTNRGSAAPTPVPRRTLSTKPVVTDL